eukprot:symbB.v1.2.022523.t1/scaffold2003.1/size92810/10
MCKPAAISQGHSQGTLKTCAKSSAMVLDWLEDYLLGPCCFAGPCFSCDAGKSKSQPLRTLRSAASFEVELAVSPLAGLRGFGGYHTSVLIAGEEYYFSPTGIHCCSKVHSHPKEVMVRIFIGHSSACAWQSGRKPVFGFGSNSVRQLRGRVGDENLMGYPARIRGQVLAFCGPNRSWAYDKLRCVGTATLIPDEHCAALGTVVFLTEEQIKVLDSYEGVPFVYQQRQFEAEVFRSKTWHSLPVMAYVRVDSQEWYEPSEAYCCAILRNLGGSFPGITRLSLRTTEGVLKSEWRHPGFKQLGVDDQSRFWLCIGLHYGTGRYRHQGIPKEN